jgi:hypothetical protein
VSLISNFFAEPEVLSSLESESSEGEEEAVEEDSKTDFKNRYSGNNVDLPECETFEVARQTWLGMCFSWMKVFTSMVCDWVRGRRVRW